MGVQPKPNGNKEIDMDTSKSAMPREKILAWHKLNTRMVGVLATGRNGSVIGQKPTLRALSRRGLIKQHTEKPAGLATYFRDTYVKYWKLTPLGEETLRQLDANA